MKINAGLPKLKLFIHLLYQYNSQHTNTEYYNN